MWFKVQEAFTALDCQVSQSSPDAACLVWCYRMLDMQFCLLFLLINNINLYFFLLTACLKRWRWIYIVLSISEQECNSYWSIFSGSRFKTFRLKNVHLGTVNCYGDFTTQSSVSVSEQCQATSADTAGGKTLGLFTKTCQQQLSTQS